jgi:hypothetical protein
MSQLFRVDRVKIGILLIVALMQIADSAQAETVTVLNPSFESQTVVNGNIALPIADWNFWSSQGGVGCVYNPMGYDAPDNDTTFGFYGASGDGTPQGGDGANLGWMFITAQQYGALQQVLDVTLQAGHTYTLTAAVGLVPGGGNIDAQFWFTNEGAGFGELGQLWKHSGVVSATTPGVLEEKTFSFTPTDEDIALYGGQKLVVGLCGVDYTGVTSGRVGFDNVRVSDVPEPSTLVLLVLAGLAFLAMKRRR